MNTTGNIARVSLTHYPQMELLYHYGAQYNAQKRGLPKLDLDVVFVSRRLWATVARARL